MGNAYGRQVDNHGIDRHDTQITFIDSIHQVLRYENLRHMVSSTYDTLYLSAHPVKQVLDAVARSRQVCIELIVEALSIVLSYLDVTSDLGT
jgi:hypothetical protein